MQSVTDRSFIDETLELDGKLFLRCSFERCVMAFNGTAVFSMADCTFGEGCQFTLGGAAVVTVRQLRALLTYGGIFTDVVKYYLFDPKAEVMLGH